MTIDWTLAIGARLKHYRLTRDWDQAKLAGYLKKSASYISELERGKHPPSTACFALILEALEVSEELFYEGLGDERVAADAQRVEKRRESGYRTRGDTPRCTGCGNDDFLLVWGGDIASTTATCQICELKVLATTLFDDLSIKVAASPIVRQ